VKWENSTDERILGEARVEILRSTGGDPPPILDPFAGGGTIPLEAQRLGLEVQASDLNPVAVLINKALIEIPPKSPAGRQCFRGPPIPASAAPGPGRPASPRMFGFTAPGCAMRPRSVWVACIPKRHCPMATRRPSSRGFGHERLFAQTRPAESGCHLCGHWWLGKKRVRKAYVVPEVADGEVRFTIGHDPKSAPSIDDNGMVGRTGTTACAADPRWTSPIFEARAGRAA